MNNKDQQIKKIEEIIEKNPAHPFMPEAAAKKFGMSRRSLERRFKACTGDTAIGYLHRIRVETAKHHLETSRMTFDEIAYLMEYEDPGFFRKIVKKYSGLLPSEYRTKSQR